MKTATQTNHTYKDGTRTITIADGFQKIVWMFKAGNDTDDADVMASTARFTNCVNIRDASGVRQVYAVNGMLTKDQIINAARKSLTA